MSTKKITFKEFLLEISLNKVDSETKKGFPTTKKRYRAVNRVVVTNPSYVAYDQSGQLLCTANTKSTDSTGGPYKTTIMFTDVKFVPDDEARMDPSLLKVTSTGGETKHYEPLFIHTANVKMNCTCESEYFDFEKYHQRNDSLAGEPRPPYVRKTKDRPPRNPMKVLGGCKHILAFAQYLKRARVVK